VNAGELPSSGPRTPHSKSLPSHDLCTCPDLILRYLTPCMSLSLNNHYYTGFLSNAELDNLLGHADLDLLSLRGSVGLDTLNEWKKNGYLRTY
jgi:hypothetical protein